MIELCSISFHYPDTGPVWFLGYMLAVIVFGLWIAKREDK
jgi:hypothetical protein